MLINLSNHPSVTWGNNQTETAKAAYGEIKDLPFPNVPPEAAEATVAQMAETLIASIRQHDNKETTIHLMGEMTLTFRLVERLKKEGYACVASTTERMVTYAEDGTKTVKFEFVRFRAY